jgi:ParB family chromosome partitioning protein
LGRGLGSLIPEAGAEAVAAAPGLAPEPYAEIDLDRIDPSPQQPRQRFAEEALEELAKSIAAHGVLQPVVVRRRGDRYQMVAGERRLRAAQRAGLRKVPALVRTIPDERMLEVALVENIQRQELDPIEEAQAFQTLLETTGLPQQALAERLGKAESTVSNSLRLLKLSDFIQEAIRAGSIAAGHARALLSVPDLETREKLARKVVRRGLSVRQSEALARGAKPSGKPAPRPLDANSRAAEERMMQALGTKVRIRREGDGGQVEIAFHSEEELDRIFEYIVRA